MHQATTSPLPEPSRWVDRAVGRMPHWHVAELFSADGGSPNGPELLASTAGVALRVLTARAGQLMVEGWSLDTGRSTDVEVHLRLDGWTVILQAWECSSPPCGLVADR